MTIPDAMLTKITTPEHGRQTTRLPTKFAHTNAALIASVEADKARQQEESRRVLAMVQRMQGERE